MPNVHDMVVWEVHPNLSRQESVYLWLAGVASGEGVGVDGILSVGVVLLWQLIGLVVHFNF